MPSKRRSVSKSEIELLLVALTDAQAALLNREWAAAQATLRGLNSIAKMKSSERQRELLDKSILDELEELLSKFRQLQRSKKVPTPEEQWAFMVELFRLLLKLTAKAFLLQRMRIPPFDPGIG